MRITGDDEQGGRAIPVCGPELKNFARSVVNRCTGRRGPLGTGTATFHHPTLALATILDRASVILPDEPSRLAAARRSTEILRSIPIDNADHDGGDPAGMTAMNHYNFGHDHWVEGRRPEAHAAFLAARAAYDHLIDRGDQGTHRVPGPAFFGR
jgi:hypothetical protein